MLGNAAPTPFDLRFSLFGIPVRVHPFFWLFTAAMGWNSRVPQLTFLWVACVFVSILVHEFGHALMAQACEADCHEVVLYAFGGYAAISPGRNYTTKRSVLISLAGPGAGFILYGVFVLVDFLIEHFGLVPVDPRTATYLEITLRMMEFINLWWGLVNLLPVYPLDGGRVARSLFTHYRYRDGLEMSLKLSLVAAGAVAAYLFMHDRGRPMNAILFASLAFENFQELQGSSYR